MIKLHGLQTGCSIFQVKANKSEYKRQNEAKQNKANKKPGRDKIELQKKASCQKT